MDRGAPHGLQFMGSQTVGHDRETNNHIIYIYAKYYVYAVKHNHNTKYYQFSFSFYYEKSIFCIYGSIFHFSAFDTH